jgi:hypothetical protein
MTERKEGDDAGCKGANAPEKKLQRVKRTRGAVSQKVAIMTAFLVIGGYNTPALGYRPFISTDAAVVDPQEIEIELGYFHLERADKATTFVTPKVVFNYGLIRGLEVVGEFEIEKLPDRGAQFVDPALFLKAVLKEGILQQQYGVSFAIEAGPLLPAPVAGEKRVGFEGIGIVSGRLSLLTYHANLGAGVNRTDTNPFAVWGMIVEAPVLPNFRLVGEINGEGTEGKRPDNSGLVGFIWQPTASTVLVDIGIRKGISREASDWQFTTGLTFSFSELSFVDLFMRRGTP